MELTVPIKVDALEVAKEHSREFYDKGYQQGMEDAILGLKNFCIEMQNDSTLGTIDSCAKCKYWSVFKGCAFYNRPCDWDVKEKNNE